MTTVNDLNIRDPFLYCEDGVYYLYFSGVGENGGPAFLCRRSRDLKESEPAKVLFEAGEGFWATRDFWAPELHSYRGKYYLFASLKSETRPRGTQVFVSDRPDGKFVPLTPAPLTPNDQECLDGTLFVDDGVPYMIYCHEWLEIGDGEMCVVRLSDDLKHTVGEPRRMFSASSAKWTRPLSADNYVTDGPFVIKKDGVYHMIWSSFSNTGYAMGRCKSASLFGTWTHDESPLNNDNGGHGMVFNKDGQNYIVYHAPNEPAGRERIRLMPFEP